MAYVHELSAVHAALADVHQHFEHVSTTSIVLPQSR